MIYDEKPWLKSYDAGVEAEIKIPDISLKDYFVNTFIEHSDRVAFHYLGMSMTFGELLEQSGRFATLLVDNGLGKGDVIAINLPNTPQYLIALVGALRAGCAISGLAPLLVPDEMVYQLNNCDARVLVTLDILFNEKFSGVADKVPGLDMVLVTGIFDPLPEVSEYPTGKPLDGKQVMPFMQMLKQVVDQPPEVTCLKEDACYLQYTGGTTGSPKGALLTHGNMVANIYQFEHWMHVKKGEEVLLSGFPIFHQAGLFIASSAMAWAATQILIPDPRDTAHIIKELEHHGPTYLINVPSLFLMLLAEESFGKLDFSGLKYCMSGAAPFPVDAINDLECIVGHNKMIEVWGMTETSPLITVNPAINQNKIGSVGLPLPNTKLRVVNLKDCISEVPMGQEGELICSGPQVMKGYLNKPEETGKTLIEHDGDIWMHTGDVGRMDEEGFVYIVDRVKDMLIVGGYKVFSSEVEDKFFKHPAIGMCAIIGIPNPDRPDSEIVKLVIQKSEEYKGKQDDEVREEIRNYAKTIMAPYKVPKIYEFVDEIPLTSIGKVDKKLMRE